MYAVQCSLKIRWGICKIIFSGLVWELLLLQTTVCAWAGMWRGSPGLRLRPRLPSRCSGASIFFHFNKFSTHGEFQHNCKIACQVLKINVHLSTVIFFPQKVFLEWDIPTKPRQSRHKGERRGKSSRRGFQGWYPGGPAPGRRLRGFLWPTETFDRSFDVWQYSTEGSKGSKGDV